jgi:hypothetical protein
MAHSPAHSSSSSDSGVSDFFLDAPQPASLAVVQTVNIRNHVPVILDLADSNYNQWRCLLDSVLGKFGLVGHVRAPPLIIDCDAEWRQINCCLVNWLCTTINKLIFDLIYKPDANAFTIWSTIEGLFRDNELQCAVLLEAEFRNVVQGDLSITDYCSKLKKLADNLRDVGHPVSEPSQVLNLICGLNKSFRHVKPVLTSKPHTFTSASSYILLEELQLQNDVKTEASQVLLATHSGPAGTGGSAGHGGTAGSSPAPGGSSANDSRGSKAKNKCRGRGPNGGSTSSGGGSTSGAPSRPQAPWAANYNTWTGVVQAWSMPFRAPGSGVLGPCPPPQQAMMAQHQLAAAPHAPPPGGQVWDTSALYATVDGEFPST